MDDPRTYGEIAAANALSDVFAMGGRVLFALSIAAFPEDLPRDVMTAILHGASSKVREAGGILAGGHTINDAEPKYGLAVTGVVHPDRMLRKGGARPGDRLFLTKRLGTGLLVSGHRQGKASDVAFDGAIRQMTTLNRAAADLIVREGVTAATDVTGFGLLGHGLEMARASGTRFVFDASALPALEGAQEMAVAGVETGGAAHNRRYVALALSVADGVAPELVTIATTRRHQADCCSPSPPIERRRLLARSPPPRSTAGPSAVSKPPRSPRSPSGRYHARGRQRLIPTRPWGCSPQPTGRVGSRCPRRGLMLRSGPCTLEPGRPPGPDAVAQKGGDRERLR